MSEKKYEIQSAHHVEKFQIGHSKDGAFLSLKFTFPPDKTITMVIPFNVQAKFVEDVKRQFKECERRQQWRNDYVEPPVDF